MFLRNASKDNVNVHYPQYTIRMICEKCHNIRYIDYLPVYYPRSTTISFKTLIFPIYSKVNACLRNNKNIIKNMLVSTTK